MDTSFAPISFRFWQLRARATDEMRKNTLECNEHFSDPGRVLLASTMPHKMTYWLYPSEERVLWMLANTSPISRQYFYLIEAERPVRTFLDFDAPAHCFTARHKFRDAVVLALSYLCRFLDACYGCLLARRHYDGEWRLFDSSHREKWSMHAHCRLVFRSVAVLGEVMRSFVLLVRELRTVDPRLGALFYSGDRCIIDSKVYNARPFRLPHNIKDGWTNAPLRPLVPLETFAEDIRWGFIHADRCDTCLEAPPSRAEQISASTNRAIPDAQAFSKEVGVLCNTQVPQIFFSDAVQEFTAARLFSAGPSCSPDRRTWAAMLLHVYSRYEMEHASPAPAELVQYLGANCSAWLNLSFEQKLAVVFEQIDVQSEEPQQHTVCHAEYGEIWALVMLVGTRFDVPNTDEECVANLCAFARNPTTFVRPTYAHFLALRRALQRYANSTAHKLLGTIKLLDAPFPLSEN